MTIKEMKELALCAAKNEAPANYSMENVNDALVEALRDMAGSVNQFMKNRYDIYEIIIEAADEVVPKNVIDAVGVFAEVRQVGQGQKALFRTNLGRTRAKKFLTQVGLSGVYETFRLDHGYFELGGHAIGGACTIDFERMLDGAEDMAELVAILSEAQTEAVYKEVHKALRAAFLSLHRLNSLLLWARMLSFRLRLGVRRLLLVSRAYIIHRISMLFITLDTSTCLEVHRLFRFHNRLLMRTIRLHRLTRNSLTFCRLAVRRLLRLYLRDKLRCMTLLIGTNRWKFILTESWVQRFLHTTTGVSISLIYYF